ASLLSISGNDINRVFSINEALDVRIAGFRITHGRAVGSNGSGGSAGAGGGGGGGIANVGSTLTLANDVLSFNVCLGSNFEAQGGAISNVNGATLTVISSMFIDNRADGRVKNTNFAEGGAIFNSSGSSGGANHATIIGSTFMGNQAIAG